VLVSFNHWNDSHGCDGRYHGLSFPLSLLTSIFLYHHPSLFFLQCVERSRFEPEDIRGQMQSNYYTLRFSGHSLHCTFFNSSLDLTVLSIGNLVGAILGSLISNKANWGWGLTFKEVLLVSGWIPLLLVCPFLLRSLSHSLCFSLCS
jgi:hypothetical protein